MLKTKISLWFQSKRNDIMGLKKKKKKCASETKRPGFEIQLTIPFPFIK